MAPDPPRPGCYGRQIHDKSFSTTGRSRPLSAVGTALTKAQSIRCAGARREQASTNRRRRPWAHDLRADRAQARTAVAGVGARYPVSRLGTSGPDQDSGCAGVAAICRALPHSANLTRKNIQKSAVFRIFGASLTAGCRFDSYAAHHSIPTVQRSPTTLSHLLSSAVQLSTTVIGEAAPSVTSLTRNRWPSRLGT